MEYFWQSIRTSSYWRYAIFSVDGIKTFLAVLGTAWGLIELSDYFHLVQREQFPWYALPLLLLVALFVVCLTRRPVHRIAYKLHGKDIAVEVRIGNVFKIPGQKIISSNTTFDTDLSNGIISTQSVQGQFTTQFYPGATDRLDAEIDRGLSGKQYQQYNKPAGKQKRYPIGTTVKIKQGNEVFYLLAMSQMNTSNVAQTNLGDLLLALDELWEFIKTQGDKEDIVIPLIGTGHGRIPTNRKQLLARIAQSFTKASEQVTFSNKLAIVIHPNDVKNFSINLFEVKDLLNNFLP